MRRDDPSEPLRVEIDAHQCDLTPEQIDMMHDDLDTLTKMVENFPRPELHVYVERESRNNEFVVKTSLLLPGQTLVTSEHNQVLHAAYEQCVDVLINQVKEYKDRLGQVPERQKSVERAPHQRLEPTVDPDLAASRRRRCRRRLRRLPHSLQGYEEPLRDRVGRWLQRIRRSERRGRAAFTIADVVEEVFLDAFEALRPPAEGRPVRRLARDA